MQGSIPFSAMQSLRPYLPFQCYSGCAKKKSNPLDMFVRFLHTLGLSSWSDPISTLNSVQTKNKIHTYQIQVPGLMKNGFGNKNGIDRWVKQSPKNNLISIGILWLYVGQTDSTTTQNHDSLLPLTVKHTNGFPQLGNEDKQQKIHQTKSPAIELRPIDFPDMGKIQNL